MQDSEGLLGWRDFMGWWWLGSREKSAKSRVLIL